MITLQCLKYNDFVFEIIRLAQTYTFSILNVPLRYQIR